jgi:hypothetical protein
MLRGLPMQGVTTQTYQAQPNLITQGIGALGTGYALQNAMGGSSTGKKAGGVVGMAKGGIASFDVGGEVEHDLEGYPIDKLKEVAQSSQSERVREMARSILKDKTSFAPGGIIAFAEGPKKGTVGDDVDEQVAQDRRNIKSGTLGLLTPLAAASDIVAGPYNYLADTRLGKAFGLPAAGDASNTPTLNALERAQGVINTPAAPVAAKPAAAVPAKAADVPAKVVDEGKKKPADEGKKKVVNTDTALTQDQTKNAQPATAGDYSNLTTEKGILAGMAPEVQKYMNTAPEQQTMEQIMKQRADYLGPNTADAEYRKQIMDSRANAADEAKRLEAMRMAEFFSTWGSTPGPTLVAGMQAAQKTIPNLIADKKEQKKAQQESDKIIHELDRAARLEKAGNWDEAAKIKEQQAKNAQNWTKAHMDVGMQASQNASALERERMSNTSAEKIARDRNATDIKTTGMRTTQDKSDQLATRELLAAQSNRDNLIKEAGKLYGDDTVKIREYVSKLLSPKEAALVGYDKVTNDAFADWGKDVKKTQSKK